MLYGGILEYQGQALFDDVLHPWIEHSQPAIAEFDRFKTYSGQIRGEAAHVAMWNLYALGRVNDLLLLSFQTQGEEGKIARVTLDGYEAFYTQLGFRVVTRDDYTPFHHEIVRAHPSGDDEEPIGVLGRLLTTVCIGRRKISRWDGAATRSGERSFAETIRWEER